MATWECPECRRSFGAVGRSHMCAPGVTIDDHIAAAGPEFGPIFHAVHDHLAALEGELIVDPVKALVLFKHGAVFCTLKPMKKWTALGFTLDRRIESSRFSRKITEYQGRFHHVMNLTGAAQIDDEVRGWLTEAFHLRTGRPADGDPMVPDDVDVEFGFDDDIGVGADC